MNDQIFMLSQIAKLYYIDKIKQNEIAKRLGITPIMVSRNLKKAEEMGIVDIHIKMPWKLDVNLGRQAMEVFGLHECVVLDNENENLQELLGEYLADYVSNIISDEMTIGLSWGKTIAQFVKAFPFLNISDCNVVQLSGAFWVDNYEVTPVSIIQTIARKLNAKLYSMNAPLYALSEQSKEELQQDPTNRMTQEMARNADINIYGASALRQNATTVKSKVISEKEYEELITLGAIGDVAGIFLDANGNELEWSRSKLYTGIPLIEILKAKNTICVAGEEEKAEILKVAAKRQYFKTLITTKKTAQKMLE